MRASRGVAIGGFMGTGKSTVGPPLARHLAMPFMDLDRAVEDDAGRTISEIFELEGEAAFRVREQAVLLRLVSEGPKVLALGGGTLHWTGWREALGDFRLLVLLAPLEVLRPRIQLDGDGRPLARNMEALFDSREAGYLTAGPGVHVGGLSVDEVVHRLVERLTEESR